MLGAHQDRLHWLGDFRHMIQRAVFHWFALANDTTDSVVNERQHKQCGKKSSQVLVVPRSVSCAIRLLQVILVQIASASQVQNCLSSALLRVWMLWLNNRLLLGVPAVGFCNNTLNTLWYLSYVFPMYSQKQPVRRSTCMQITVRTESKRIDHSPICWLSVGKVVTIGFQMPTRASRQINRVARVWRLAKC